MENLADAKKVKAKRSAVKQVERMVDDFCMAAMGTTEGRAFFFQLLDFCHVHRISFDTHGLTMAFREGERNVGLMIQAQLVRLTPKAYVAMMEENYYGRVDPRYDTDTDPGEPVSDVGYPRTEGNGSGTEADS